MPFGNKKTMLDEIKKIIKEKKLLLTYNQIALLNLSSDAELFLMRTANDVIKNEF